MNDHPDDPKKNDPEKSDPNKKTDKPENDGSGKPRSPSGETSRASDASAGKSAPTGKPSDQASNTYRPGANMNPPMRASLSPPDGKKPATPPRNEPGGADNTAARQSKQHSPLIDQLLAPIPSGGEDEKITRPQMANSKSGPQDGESETSPGGGGNGVGDLRSKTQDPPKPSKDTINAPAGDAGGFSPRRFVVAGYILLVVCVGGLGGWAATAPLASAVIATGTVSVESNRKTIQHLEGGIIQEILVRDSDQVEAGDVLLRLTATEAKASNTMLRNRYVAALASRARLNAERAGREEIDFPIEIRSDPTPETQELIAYHQLLFDDRRAGLKAQIDVLLARIQQFDDRIIGMEISKETSEKRWQSALEEAGRLRSGQGTGAVATNRLTAMEREASELRGIVGRYLAEIAQAKGQITQVRQEIIAAEQSFRERAAGELKSVQDEINELEERLIVSRDVLERTEIRTPRRGIVQNLRVHTLGGVVRPGEPIMEIIPLGDALIVNARVQPIDVDSISADLEAEVRFPAFSSRTLPLILGKVEYISPDIISPEDMRVEPYYLARVVVEEHQIPKKIKGRLVPGMPADVIIATNERTVLQYLVAPLSDAITKSMREE